MIKHIAVFTGNRADYGLLAPLLTHLQLYAPWAVPSVWVGGEHLIDESSLSHIEADQWEQVVMLDEAHYQPISWEGLTWIGAWHQQAVQCVLEQGQTPDAVIVLGDRHEAMAVTLACYNAHVPVIHLAAGDTTEGGALDDRYRHAISMLATARVAFSQASYQRLLAMGFSSETLLQTASLSVDNALNESLYTKTFLCQELGLNETDPVVLFTQHPMSIEGERSAQYLWESLEALHEFGCTVVATPPNLDGCSDALQRVMQQSRQQHPGIVWANHLGRRKYLSWLSVCSAVVGNTSSGLYESPLFNKPSLTIGPRQQGRERGTNVVAVGYGKASVLAGLKTVLEDASFIEGCMRTVSPFGHHPAAPEITEALLYWLTEPASRANVSY